MSRIFFRLVLVGSFPEPLKKVPNVAVQRLKGISDWYQGEKKEVYTEIFKISDQKYFNTIYTLKDQEGREPSSLLNQTELGLGIIVGLYDHDNEEYRGALLAIISFDMILNLASKYVKEPAYLTLTSEGREVGRKLEGYKQNTITMMSKLKLEDPISQEDLNIEMFIYEPYEKRFETANNLLYVLVITITMMIFVIVGITYYFTIKISMPLTRLNDIVADFTLGNYDTVKEDMGFKEFRRFLNTLNSMGSSIKGKIYKLETLSDTSQKIAGINQKNKVIHEVVKVAMNRLGAHSAHVVVMKDNQLSTQTLETIYGDSYLKLIKGMTETDIYQKIVKTSFIDREDRYERIALPGRVEFVVIVKTFGDRDFGLYCIVFFGDLPHLTFGADENTFLATLSRITAARLRHIHMLQLIEEQNQSLEKNVALRTAELATRNRDMQSILANMKQGIFTIDGDKKIQAEYSLYLEEIFGRTDIAGKDAIKILFEKSHCGEDLVEQVNEVINVSIGEFGFCFELNCHLLVYEIVLELEQGQLKHLELDWEKIENENGLIEKLLVVVKDVSKIKDLEEKSSKSTEQVEVFNRIIEIGIDRFESMVQELETLLSKSDEILSQKSPFSLEQRLKILLRDLHTIKGNARLLKLGRIAQQAHTMESLVKSMVSKSISWQPRRLKMIVDSSFDVLSGYAQLADKVKASFSTSNGTLNLSHLENLLMQGASMNHDRKISMFDDICRQIFELKLKTAEEILSPSMSYIEEQCARLSIEIPEIRVENDGRYFPLETASTLSDIFIHCINNSLAHGIESGPDRIKIGKRRQGLIKVVVYRASSGLKITYEDDGRGLNLNRLKKLNNASDIHDIANTIFESGVTTTETVTELAGRGVGLDAVKELLEQKGASIRIAFENEQFEPYKGFKLEIELPEKMAIVFNHSHPNLVAS